MSTNIKLLIALLLGAAIGALLMKKISTPHVANTDEQEVVGKAAVQLTKINLKKDTNPLPFEAAQNMVRSTEVDALLNSKTLYMVDNGTKRAIKSWLMEKDDVLALLGVEDFIDSDSTVKGMRCYLGFNKDTSRGGPGYTLVCVPADSAHNVIRRVEEGENKSSFPAAIEYHMPCPKNCGTTRLNDLSR